MQYGGAHVVGAASRAGFGGPAWAWGPPAALTLAFGVATVVAPARLQQLAAKEGAIEGVSHVVLAVALVAWLARAVQARRLPSVRWGLFAMVLYCAVVLAEELDWGAAVGIDFVADRLRAATGRPDLHNAWGGESYVAFGLPLLAVAAAGWWGWPGARGPWPGPDRGDVQALALVVVTSLAVTLLAPGWERAFDEVAELALYLVLLAMTRSRGIPAYAGRAPGPGVSPR